jgi:putative membrane protein
MTGFILRVLIVALGLWVATKIVSGISAESGWTLLGAALLLGIVTLVFFLLVINAGMLGLVALFIDGFHVAGFWSALFGALVVSCVGWIASWLIGPRGRVEVMVESRKY